MILYIGTYTTMLSPTYGGHATGIYVYDFDTESGSLTHLHTTETRNPTWICMDRNRKVLFAVEEIAAEEPPYISAFAIESDHSLRLLNKQSIPGAYPCHLEMPDADSVAVACYGTGHIAVYPLNEDGSLNPASVIQQHQGSSINKDRQEGPHAHMIAPVNGKGEFAVCDLGIDQVLFYQLNDSGIETIQKVEMPAGSGPRHIAFHKNGKYAFVMNELTTSVSVLTKEASGWKLQQTYPALPVDYQGGASGSAIRIHPSGRFAYSANRGHNSLTIWAFDEKEGTLSVSGHQPTGGTTPREFNLTPDGKWLLVGHHDSDSIMAFRVDEFSGKLTKETETAVASPVCFCWQEA